MVATIREVAKQANVSIATISRVLNNSLKVDSKTREDILKIIKKANYHPNVIAQRLSKQRTFTIGVFLPNVGPSFQLSYTRAEILRGIGTIADEDFGYDVLLKLPQNDKGIYDYIRLFDEKKVDGAIIIFPDFKDSGLKDLEKKKVNVVLVNTVSNKLDYIDIDNEGSSLKTMEHIIELGRRRIAAITGRREKSDDEARFNAYKLALEKHGIPYIAELVEKSAFSEEASCETMKKLLVYKPDAVFTTDDKIAIGAMRAIKDAGLRMPEDIAIVGFDDIPLASSVVPQLTTIRQPFFELGKESVKMLVARVEGKVKKQQKKIIPGELIVRSSTKKLI